MKIFLSIGSRNFIWWKIPPKWCARALQQYKSQANQIFLMVPLTGPFIPVTNQVGRRNNKPSHLLQHNPFRLSFSSPALTVQYVYIFLTVILPYRFCISFPCFSALQCFRFFSCLVPSVSPCIANFLAFRLLRILCHEMNNFLKAYYDKYVLSLQAVIVFTIFCFSLEWKNQTQSFSLLL